MAILATPTLLSRINSREYKVRLRVMIEDQNGVLQDYSSRDGVNWQQSASWGASTNQRIPDFRVELKREAGGLSLAPLVSGTVNSGGRAIEKNRRLQIFTASVDRGVEPVAGDWVLMLDGHIQQVAWGGKEGNLILTGVEKTGALQRRIIRTKKEYGSEAGVNAATVAQQILDDNFGAGVWTMTTPAGAPAFTVTSYTPFEVSVWEALETLTGHFGWVNGPKWNGTDWALAMFPPVDVATATPVGTIGPTQYLDVQTLDEDLAMIRNVVRIVFFNRETGDNDFVEVRDQASIDAFEESYIGFTEDSTSAIDTRAEANAMAEAILRDLATAPTKAKIDNLYWQPVEVGDVITWAANPQLHTSAQTWAVDGFRHSLTESAALTSFDTSGKAVAHFERYFRVGSEKSERKEAPAVLALKNFRETRISDTEVRYDAEPTAATEEVWVYKKTLAKPVTTEPWPTEATPVTDYEFLPAATAFPYVVTVPPEGKKTYLQFEPRSADFRVGEIRRGTIDSLPGAVPTIQNISQAPATNPGPAKTNVSAVVMDPLNRAGRLYAWLNHGVPGEADPTGQADGYLDMAGPRGVTAADVWTLTAGGTANLFRDLTVHAQYGKRIWLEWVAEDGTSTGQVSELLRTWHQIIVGATGAWVDQIVTEAAIAHRAIGTMQLKIAGVERDNLIDEAVSGAKLATNTLDLTQFNRVVLDNAIAAGKLSVNQLSEITDNVGIIVSGTLRNGPGTTYLDLNATGANPILYHHGKFALTADGGASFGGTITSAATVTGRIIVAGNLAGGAVDVSTVIADGVITAPKLQIAELSAISNNVGIVLSGRLRNGGDTVGINLDGSPTGTWAHYMNMGGTGYFLYSAVGGDRKFSVDFSGNAFFKGEIQAATGSFGGSLSAATGSFAGSLSAATGEFAGDLSASIVKVKGGMQMTRAINHDESAAIRWGEIGGSSVRIKPSADVWAGTAPILYIQYQTLQGDWPVKFEFQSNGFAYATSWSVYSPKPPKPAEQMTAADWLGWGAEDAKKPLLPYEGLPGDEHPFIVEEARRLKKSKASIVERERARYGKDVAKIAIGTARWAEQVWTALEQARDFDHFKQLLQTQT